MLRHLDLFSGIGGFALAARMVGGIQTAQFVEIDPYAQKVLAKNFPGVPIHDDVTTFTADRGSFDLVTFGSPCQDFSCANPNGRGLEGERSGLFYEAIRVLCVVRPRFAVFENVANVLTKDGGMQFQRILRAFYESGFNAEWQVISAASVGAPHLRERVFIVAYSQCIRFRKGNSISQRIREPKKAEVSFRATKAQIWRNKFWATEPGVLRVANGIPDRVDRIRGLGNAVVPQVATIALKRVLTLSSNLL